MMWNDGYFFHGGFMWIFWILLIAVIVFIFMNVSKGNSSSASESPLEILKKRYARGEIDEEEYERRRKVLEK